MYVLGINGWDKGVHDTSASLFYQGKLLAAAEEERFIRRKKLLTQCPFILFLIACTKQVLQQMKSTI